jgi:hypothetical protein
MARLLLKGDAMAVQFEKGRRDVREAREDEMHAKMGEQEVIQLLMRALINHNLADFVQRELTDYIARYDSVKLPDGQPRWRRRTETAKLLLEQL